MDQIVDELAKDPAVSEAYRAWGEWQDQSLLTYSSKAPPLPPLSSQKQLKSIKNMVIAEALKLGGHHFFSETSGQKKIQTEVRLDELEERIPDGSEEIEETEIELDVPDPSKGEEKNSAKAEWSRQYKLARSYLYGSKKVPQDFQKAMNLFRLEAELGNALAMYDLGRMWADGLGVEADPDAAKEWYRKALNAFLSAEKKLPERKKTYLQYRIGKMYLAGLGTDQDYETAALWLERAAEKSHKYAQYTLAGLYAKGQGVERDLKRAFSLYHASATQGNPYASYELAKMFRDGTGTERSAGQAEEHFQDAFSGFLVLEEQSHDDKLQYRLGQMLYQGIGTEKDEEEAVRYWQQAAKLGNVNAQYALGKFWLDIGTGDVQQGRNVAGKGGRCRNIHAYDEDVKWQLAEPGALMSAKNYRDKKALPLVERLKEVVKNLTIKCVQLTEQGRKLTAKVDGQQVQISRLTDKVMEQNNIIDRLQEKASDLGRLERHLGREQVQSIVERSKALEQVERSKKRPKRAFEMCR